jgi:hypothetical protein
MLVVFPVLNSSARLSDTQMVPSISFVAAKHPGNQLFRAIEARQPMSSESR